ncbi:MAG: hypothetical protein HDT33_04635 [Clostridiales bacterium]|nr:hypothetical protein [Clostridiales bacterium]
MKKECLSRKQSLAMALSLTLILLLGAGCDGTPKGSSESAAQPELPSAGIASDAQPESPAAETAGIIVSPTPPEPSKRPAAVYRLVFPEECVFTCEASYSSAEAPICLSKDRVENGWVSYEESLMPFSDYLLEHPDASLLMWAGIHNVMLESWEISLNDGWICYMYRGEMDHATGTFDPGGRGTIYSAMIGWPEDPYVFCLYWNNYFETDFEEPLESFQEGDPGYVSLEDMRSFLSGITVERDTEQP